MDEYLSKETLQAKLNRKKAGPANKRYTEGWNDAILMVKSMIHSEKAAEVAPVRHGRWLDGKCTACGWEEPDVCTWLGYDSEAWIETPYCPNCGAIMDGN